MASSPPAAVARLEIIVEKGEVDGRPTSRVINDPAYYAIFCAILSGTFRSRLTRTRKRYGNQALGNVGNSLLIEF